MKDIDIEVVKNLKAFAFDVDGILFPNENWWFSDGVFAKRRSLYDGQGISLLRAIGMRVVFITSAKGEMAKPVISLIEKWNELPTSKSGENPNGWEHVRLYDTQSSTKKKESLEAWLSEIGVTANECGAMGDDLVDLVMLRAVAFAAAPAQAEQVIKNECHFVSARNGGEGAIRDVVNYILEIKDIDPRTLPLQ
jgi:3-deoxy-D-manno-octulosonate 8-phosphate phosphatase (KDO 8-P phosphatase)